MRDGYRRPGDPLPRATRPWLLGSDEFSVLRRRPENDGYSRWQRTPHQYVREERRYLGRDRADYGPLR